MNIDPVRMYFGCIAWVWHIATDVARSVVCFVDLVGGREVGDRGEVSD